jgi:four helix bundle protein
LEQEAKKPNIASYRDLRVYQRSYQLALEVHRLTQKFPVFERRELGSQLRRAATSIPANIAEGYGRKRSADEFKRFLTMALGSCNEISVQLNFAKDLGYVSPATSAALLSECEEIGKGIHKLISVWR